MLFGDTDPGGRLPVSFGAPQDHPPWDEAAYPGIDDAAQYAECVFVGYRHFGRAAIEPVFPFGHVLSYASIEYGEPKMTDTADGGTVEVPLRNTSDRPGSEVVHMSVEKSAAPVET